MKRKTHQTVRSERRRQGKRLRCFAPSPASDNSKSEGSTTSTGSIRANIRIQNTSSQPLDQKWGTRSRAQRSEGDVEIRDWSVTRLGPSF
nr:hypothetical protein Iba_chr08cCG11510 [Ipomoea batatas]GMD75369.1 hypothetical protein Iba_scaffold306913CG0010 [Ipomoea batatas]